MSAKESSAILFGMHCRHCAVKPGGRLVERVIPPGHYREYLFDVAIRQGLNYYCGRCGNWICCGREIELVGDFAAVTSVLIHECNFRFQKITDPSRSDSTTVLPCLDLCDRNDERITAKLRGDLLNLTRYEERLALQLPRNFFTRGPTKHKLPLSVEQALYGLNMYGTWRVELNGSPEEGNKAVLESYFKSAPSTSEGEALANSQPRNYIRFTVSVNWP